MSAKAEVPAAVEKAASEILECLAPFLAGPMQASEKEAAIEMIGRAFDRTQHDLRIAELDLEYRERQQRGSFAEEAALSSRMAEAVQYDR